MLEHLARQGGQIIFSTTTSLKVRLPGSTIIATFEHNKQVNVTYYVDTATILVEGPKENISIVTQQLYFISLAYRCILDGKPNIAMPTNAQNAGTLPVPARSSSLANRNDPEFIQIVEDICRSSITHLSQYPHWQ